MNQKVVVHPNKPRGSFRSSSIGSSSSNMSNSSSNASAIPSPPSSELCALMGFAYRLGSVVHNDDPDTDGSNSDVRREAKLLMSLSCSSPSHEDEDSNSYNINHNVSNNDSNDNRQSDGEMSTVASFPHVLSSSSSIADSMSASTGRITPTHSITSISSVGSRRDTFCFTCPSLSLDKTRGNGNTPGVMLSRTLKVDDQHAMRLSSEAMARNIIESFQKAIAWRIQSWVDSLSRVLVFKEMELQKAIHNMGKASKAKQQQLLQQELIFSNEALLVKTLKDIEGKLQVLRANTAFKVLNKVSQVDETGSALKKRRKGEEEDRTGLGEGEYIYDVIHVLEMQCALNISTPAGNVRIDLNVPGKITGTFLSSEDDVNDGKLTDVTIDLNTDMMASMIEKSSRIAVRSSTEALLTGDIVQANDGPTKSAVSQKESAPVTTSVAATPSATRSPKRKVDDDSRTGLVLITPARHTSSSPSSFGESSDSDGDHNQPVMLSIPLNLPSSKQHKTIHQPQASRAKGVTNTPGLAFAARLPPKKFMLQQKSRGISVVVTPLKTKGPQYIEREKGPNLPILLQGASTK